MVKDKHPERGSSGPGQKGNQPQEATIFSPDGVIQHRRFVSGEQAPAPDQGKPADQAPVRPAVIPPDMDPALLKRIADEMTHSAEEKADELAEAIYAKFMHLLTERITDKGGSLTMDDVNEMGEDFRAQIGDIKETFLKAVESYTQARDETCVSSERENVFNRFLSHQFEDRFVNESELKERPDLLSRRMLPGFYSALSMMFGPPKLARYEQQCKSVIDRLRKESNGQIKWADVYNSPEARRLVLRAEIDIARHFKDTDKRLDWMIAMINSNMIPLEDGKISSGWRFSREAAEAMLARLFHDLRSALENDTARQRFTDELGDETVMVLETVTRRFA